MTAVALIVAVVTLLPIIVVVGRGLAMSPAEALDYLVRPRIGELFSHTVGLTLITVPLSVVVGVGTAWLVERTDLPGAGVWRILMAAPLAVPAFVSAYAWVSVRPGLEGLGGAVLVTTLAYFPFVHLPVAAILRDLDPSAEEDARSLGLAPFAAWWRTVLPRLRPAISGGALLVALHLLAEYGVLELMRYPTFTTAILQQYAIGFTSDAGNLLAVVLIGLCLTVLTLEVLVRGTSRTSRVGRGVHRQGTRRRLGRWAVPATGALGLLILLALVVPVSVVARWLGTYLQDSGASSGPSILLTTGSTVVFALSAAALATLVALPGAWLLSRRRTLLASLLERATYIASSLPGVVIALVMITLTVNWLPAIYQSPLLLVIAYTILFIPRAMVSLRAGMAAAPPELGEAAHSLGAGRSATFVRVVLPLILPSALTGAALVAVATATELTATLLLAPTGTSTLAIAFWAASSQLDYVAASPYAAMMILLSAPLTILMLRQSGASR